MEIGHDTVVVEFIAHVQGLMHGLEQIEQRARDVGRSVSATLGGGRGAAAGGPAGAAAQAARQARAEARAAAREASAAQHDEEAWWARRQRWAEQRRRFVRQVGDEAIRVADDERRAIRDTAREAERAERQRVAAALAGFRRSAAETQRLKASREMIASSEAVRRRFAGETEAARRLRSVWTEVLEAGRKRREALREAEQARDPVLQARARAEAERQEAAVLRGAAAELRAMTRARDAEDRSRAAAIISETREAASLRMVQRAEEAVGRELGILEEARGGATEAARAHLEASLQEARAHLRARQAQAAAITDESQRRRAQAAASVEYARSLNEALRRSRDITRSGEEQRAVFSSIERRLSSLNSSFRRAAFGIGTGSFALDVFATRIDIASMAMWKFTIAAIPLRNLMYTFAGIAAASGSLVVGLARQAAWLVVTRKQFENFAGSAALANEKLNWLRDQAPKIVYSLQEVVEAGRLLTSAGYDITTLIYPMADLAAGLNQQGIGIVEATRAFVDAMHGEIRRLKNTFNISQTDILKFSRATSWTMFQTLSASERQAAILSAIQERYPRANKAALESVLGAWSDFKDRVSRLAQDVGRYLLPPLQWIIDRGRAVVGWFLGLSEGAKKLAAYTALFSTVAAGIGAIAMALGTAYVAIQGLRAGVTLWLQLGRGALAEMIRLHVQYERIVAQLAATELSYRRAELAAISQTIASLREEAAARAMAGAAGGRAAAGAAVGAGAGAVGAAAVPSAEGVVAGAGMTLSRVLGIASIVVVALTAIASLAKFLYERALEKQLRRLCSALDQAATQIESTTVVRVPQGVSERTRELQRLAEAWKAVARAGAGPKEAPGILARELKVSPATARRMYMEAVREAEARGTEYVMVPFPQAAGPPARAPKVTPWEAALERINEQVEKLTGPTLRDIERADEAAVALIERRIAAIQRRLSQEKSLTEEAKGRLRSELDELRTLKMMPRVAEELKRYDERRAQELRSRVMGLQDMLDIMRDMGEEEADSLALLRKAYSAYVDTKDAIAKIAALNKERAGYDKAGVEVRERELAILRRQLGLVKELGEAVAARYRIRAAEPFARIFAAAAGEEAVAEAILARAALEQGLALFRAARIAVEPAERERLEREGAEAIERGLKGELGLRRRLHELALERIDLEEDEARRARMRAAELRRYARERLDEWAVQERALRRMGVTEEEVSALRERHQKEYDQRMSDILNDYSNQVTHFEQLIETKRKALLPEALRGLPASVRAAVRQRSELEIAWLQGQIEAVGRHAREELERLARERAQTWRQREAWLRQMDVGERDIARARWAWQTQIAQLEAEARREETRAAELMEERARQAREEEISALEERLSLIEDMAEKGYATEAQLLAIRRQAAAVYMQQARDEKLSLADRIRAYHRLFNLLTSEARRAEERTRDVVAQIIGAPQEIVQRVASPLSLAFAWRRAGRWLRSALGAAPPGRVAPAAEAGPAELAEPLPGTTSWAALMEREATWARARALALFDILGPERAAQVLRRQASVPGPQTYAIRVEVFIDPQSLKPGVKNVVLEGLRSVVPAMMR